jgi:hypothetical protein
MNRPLPGGIHDGNVADAEREWTTPGETRHGEAS